MKKLVALLALALLVALPACRKDKDTDYKKNDRRAKTTKYDGKGKKAYEKKAPAKKAGMRRNMNNMIDEEDLADGEQRRNQDSRRQDARRQEKHEHRGDHKSQSHYGNKNRATMLDCDDLD
jgi:hypothetical protein